MALAIAVQLVKVYPDAIDKELTPEEIPGTMEYLIKEREMRESVGRGI